MTDFENVSELVRKTGASFEEARYAYEVCGKDMLAAAEMMLPSAIFVMLSRNISVISKFWEIIPQISP